jgi:glycosyltransferase involved in cell wall biosynthesis
MDNPTRVAVIGNYLPRQCGIATFTTDVCRALATTYPETDVFAVPVNDIEEGYDYPPQVRFELAEQEVASYRRAADFLNVNSVDVVNVQHEYGIFGGSAGSYVLSLIKRLRIPVVTTLHTVLDEPDPEQFRVLKELGELSDRFIVMAQRGYDYLRDIYDVPEEKIDFIHHGIPNFAFADPNFHKDRFGVEGKTVLLTFGLLSPNKGIEYAIEALPAIVAQHPNVVYMVLGATHPNLLRQDGESYRLKLQRRARDLGVENNVIFHNRFVELDELIEFINAADVYVCPYLNHRQLVSGTIAYAAGAGKAVVSTPLWYSEEILADGRGVIVPAKDSGAIATEVLHLLDDEIDRHAMRKKAYMFGRDMVWSEVAQRYVESFERARATREAQPKVGRAVNQAEMTPLELPPLRLDHLRHMTDRVGIFRYAKSTVPDYAQGYSIDDNAMGLIVTVMLERQGEKVATVASDLATSYMGFLSQAFVQDEGRFRSRMSFDRRWDDSYAENESHGRALWALGAVIGRSANQGLARLAVNLFEEALPSAKEFQAVRACAFTLLAVQEYLRRFYGHSEAQDVRAILADRLMTAFQDNSAEEWPWFEEKLTYQNARIPHALMVCGQWLDRSDMVDVALQSLEWLAKIQRREEGHFVPVGSHGFYPKGGPCARFEQMPGEASAMIAACLQAHRFTNDQKWLTEAQRAFHWFFGANDLGVSVFDPTTGGCFDGLQADDINQNQGAEATLSYLLALMDMTLAEDAIAPETAATASRKETAVKAVRN